MTNPGSGVINQAQVFVATLGASGYIFATAVNCQTTPDWLKCNALALEFFDGVPRFVVPDNLNVGADAELTQLPKFHRPSLTPRELLSLLDFCSFGDGTVLRRHLGKSEVSINSFYSHHFFS